MPGRRCGLLCSLPVAAIHEWRKEDAGPHRQVSMGDVFWRAPFAGITRIRFQGLEAAASSQPPGRWGSRMRENRSCASLATSRAGTPDASVGNRHWRFLLNMLPDMAMACNRKVSARRCAHVLFGKSTQAIKARLCFLSSEELFKILTARSAMATSC